MPTSFKNTWGSAGSGLDQQRADLYKVIIELPRELGGSSRWNSSVEFAMTRFPFPDRKTEMLAIKRGQQTNFSIGPDQQTGPIELPIRYAFNRDTAEVLEKWHQLTANPRTGASSLTTAVKTNGEFQHLIPNQTEINRIGQQPSGIELVPGLRWKLEGILIAGFTPAQGDNTATGDGALHMYSINLQIDRYYPYDINNMVF